MATQRSAEEETHNQMCAIVPAAMRTNRTKLFCSKSRRLPILARDDRHCAEHTHAKSLRGGWLRDESMIMMRWYVCLAYWSPILWCALLLLVCVYFWCTLLNGQFPICWTHAVNKDSSTESEWWAKSCFSQKFYCSDKCYSALLKWLLYIYI